MGLIPQTKCSRCDRTYSGLRSRCPYCGASRSKRGKRVSDGNNATWKLIIGVLLIVVLIAAVVVIIVTGSNEKTPANGEQPGGTNNPPVDDEPGKNPDGNPDPTKAAEVQVKNAAGETIATLTLKKDETIDLTAVISPDTATGVPVWTSSNSASVGLMALDTTGKSYRLTGLAAGSSTVTVIVDSVKYEFTVQVTEDGTTPGGPDNPGGTGTPGGTIATGVRVRTMYGDYMDNMDDEVTLSVNEQCDLFVVVTPSTATSPAQWTNSNPAAVELVPADETGMTVTVTGMGYGMSTITVTVDGVSYEMIFRCNG